MIIRTLISLTLFISFGNLSIEGQCIKSPLAFQAGEELHYEAVYNWGFIWVNAGTVSFSAKQGTYRNQPVYIFDSYGSSLKSYDWFYKVRDHFQSYLSVDQLHPVWFNQDTYEGGYETKNTFHFDYKDSLINAFVENSNTPFEILEVPMKPCTFDVLSLIYFARSLNLTRLKPGEKVPIRAIIDGEIYELYIRYLGKEKAETRNGKIYNCIKFSALLVEGTIFKGGEDLTVWATDDANRVPVVVESKILVGSVKAILTSAKGTVEPLKYDLKP